MRTVFLIGLLAGGFQGYCLWTRECTISLLPELKPGKYVIAHNRTAVEFGYVEITEQDGTRTYEFRYTKVPDNPLPLEVALFYQETRP